MGHKFGCRKSSYLHSRNQIKINSRQATTTIFELLIRKSIKCSDKVAGQFYLDVSRFCMASTDEDLFLFPL